MSCEDERDGYEEARGKASEFYSRVGTIASPLFKEQVHFTSEGFNHIIFSNARSERERSSQILRFKLLPLALELVKLSTTYQEFEESMKEFVVKIHKKRVRKVKPVRYWGIIAIIRGRKIKVILRQIGNNGTIHFWSIVPAWMTNKYRDVRFFSTMKGNPDED